MQGLDYSYLYNEDTIWKLERAEAARLLPALNALCGSGLFFTSKDAVSFCSFVLPELGRKITIDDPDRLLLNQIPLEPVVQFYLDAPHTPGNEPWFYGYGPVNRTPDGNAHSADFQNSWGITFSRPGNRNPATDVYKRQPLRNDSRSMMRIIASEGFNPSSASASRWLLQPSGNLSKSSSVFMISRS